MRRNSATVSFFLGLVIILSASFAGIVIASAGTYHLSSESVKVWTTKDGSVDLLYNVTLSLDSGENIGFVTVGQPKGNFTIGSAMDQYGNVLSATDASEGGDYKIKVVFNTPLSIGHTLWFTLTTNVAGVIHNDTVNPEDWGMQFVPCWWPVSVDDLKVTIIMPSWLGFNSSLVKASPSWNSTFTEDSRLAVFWEKQNLLPNQQFQVGVSFPGPNPASAQKGEVVMYEPTDDTYVDSSNQNSNYGGQDHLEVSRWANSQTHESMVWVRFDFYEVPDGAVVDKAVLQLYASVVSETYSVQAYSCHDDSWSELALTYANMPSYNTTSLDSVLVGAGDRWYNWSVADAVRDALSGGSKTVTLVLGVESLHSPASGVSFDSKEYPVYPPYEYAPKLIIDYGGIMKIDVSPSKAAVGLTYGWPVNVTVSDSQDSSDIFNVTVYANTTVIATQIVDNVLNRTAIPIAFNWDTAGFAYGNYAISVYVIPGSGEKSVTDGLVSGGWVVVTIPGDINGDFKVGLTDLTMLAKDYGSTLGSSKWNANADIDGSGVIGLSDLVILARNYGQHWP